MSEKRMPKKLLNRKIKGNGQEEDCNPDGSFEKLSH
jgi:hypothetical protein